MGNCCCKHKPRSMKDPLLKLDEIYDEPPGTLSDIIENKKIDWKAYEEPESKEDYYRMVGEAAFLKQKLIGK